MTTLFLNIGLLNSFLLVAGSTAGHQDTDQFTSKSRPIDKFEPQVVQEQPNGSGSVAVHTNCTNPFITLSTEANQDRTLLLTFSVLRSPDGIQRKPLACLAHLTSPPPYVISAVLLEHSACGGGVFVLLWDAKRRQRWDVCSSWHAPGPDFIASSGTAAVSIEARDLSDRCDFTIGVKATDMPSAGGLEVRSLSATEGTVYVVQKVQYTWYRRYSRCGTESTVDEVQKVQYSIRGTESTGDVVQKVQ